MIHPLTAWRAERNRSQQSLAAEIGATQAALSQWECGRRAPSSRFLLQLSTITGIAAADLLEASAPSARGKH